MLSAVIVAYKTPAELAAALASLRAQTRSPDEVVVVDNGAADGEPVPDGLGVNGVRIVRPETNLGFGAGCNLGIAEAAGDEVLLLNADVVLAAQAVEALTHRLHQDSRIGVVGPLLLSGGEVQMSARAFPRLRTGVLGRRSPLTRLLIRARRYPTEFSLPFHGGGRVDWVSGACMLASGEALEAVNGFDPDYFLYWEDADLCRRLADCGWHVHYEPAAVVHHATAASGMSERTVRAFHESAARFASRHIARSPAQRTFMTSVLRVRCFIALRMFARSSGV